MPGCTQGCETTGDLSTGLPKASISCNALSYCQTPDERDWSEGAHAGEEPWRNHGTRVRESDASEAEASLPSHAWIVTGLNSNVKSVFDGF